MILSQQIKKEQIHQRFTLKNAEESFKNIIVNGTNCSLFESEIIAEKAKESFGLGQYEEKRTLLDGQMIFTAVKADVPPGVALIDSRKKRIVLTLLKRDEDVEALKKYKRAGMRRQQILRLAQEAMEQETLLSQEDLSYLLGCDVRTIRADIHYLRKEKNTLVPTRGTIMDIGPGVTHKERAIELWLEGKEPLEVARHLNHSLKAIERYTQTFCRVVYAQRTLRNLLKTAMVVGISSSAAAAYWEIHCSKVQSNKTYQERLDEILQCGQSHWAAQDGKKNPSWTPTKEDPR